VSEHTGRRIQAIDATRGTAMLFVFISHFGFQYFSAVNNPGMVAVLQDIGKVAAPTFMLISGMMLGFLYRTQADRFGKTAMRMVDRGLFLGIVGHAILNLEVLPGVTGFRHGIRWVFMTDVIALCIIIGPWIVRRLSARRRFLLALGLFLLSWVVIIGWQPGSTKLVLLKQLLFGKGEKSLYTYCFPILPWIAIYLMGTPIGERIAALREQGATVQIEKMLWKIGVGSVVTSFLFTSMNGALLQGSLIDSSSWMYRLFAVIQKNPPAPAYVLFYGGIGVMILADLFSAERNGRLRRYLTATARLGQASLFAFLLQGFVFNTVYPFLPWRPTPFWPLYLAATIVVLYAASAWWLRRGYNRWFTVGFGRPGRRKTAANRVEAR